MEKEADEREREVGGLSYALHSEQYQPPGAKNFEYTVDEMR